MALILPTVGENLGLAFLLGLSAPGNQTLKLYIGDTPILDATVASDFTEMSTMGYAAKTLTKASWVVAQSSGVAQGSYAEQTWTFTGGTLVSVYGYFVVDSTTGTLLWAERFTTSKDIVNNGDIIKITPKITLSKV